MQPRYELSPEVREGKDGVPRQVRSGGLARSAAGKLTGSLLGTLSATSLNVPQGIEGDKGTSNAN